jgi:hypothetical protein
MCSSWRMGRCRCGSKGKAGQGSAARAAWPVCRWLCHTPPAARRPLNPARSRAYLRLPLLCMTRMLCCSLVPATAPPQMCTREAAAAAREAVEARLRAKRAMDDEQVAALMSAEVRRCEGLWLASCLGGWVKG